ncbi:nickel pincer cofactor biosynthesis protein LarC [candidate division KSB1 bacterium]|nr:MAG: nickel pincer cofactor biosynthesis protein LarC [candidate division KSB1 bacterium]
MKIAYFDCFSGASGDMILGCLIDLGVDEQFIEKKVKETGIDNFRLKKYIVNKNILEATKVDVIVKKYDKPRNIKDIQQLVNKGSFSERSRDSILKIFRRIAESESRVHGIPVEKVHFHEVGAVDSVVDVIGAVIGFEYLGIEKFYSSSITLGSGRVKCSHGIIPVPSPATLELIKGFPVTKREIQCELCTPTGAAIITSLAEYREFFPDFLIENIGYGAGTKNIKEFPNVLRIIIGKEVQRYQEDKVILIETNIDDMTPEIYTYIMEKLFESNAIDVYITPVIMKKGRPGNVLSVITDIENMENILNIIFKESSTLGVRIKEVRRKKLKM